MAEMLWVHWETAGIFQLAAYPPHSGSTNPALSSPVRFLSAQVRWLIHLVCSIPLMLHLDLFSYFIRTTWDYCLVQIIALCVLWVLLYITSKHTIKNALVFAFCTLSLGLWVSCYLKVLNNLEHKLDALNFLAKTHCTSWKESLANPEIQHFWENKEKYMANFKTPAHCRQDICNLTDWGNHPFSTANGSLWVLGLVWLMLITGFTPYQRKSEHLPQYFEKGPLLLVLFALLQIYTWAPFVTLWLIASDAALTAILCFSLTSEAKFKGYYKARPYSLTTLFNCARMFFATIAIVVDSILFLGAYPSSFWKLLLEVGLAVWVICWFLKLTASYKKMPAESAFLVYSIGQCVLIGTVAKLQQMFFFDHMAYILCVLMVGYLAPTTRAYARVPDFAVEAYRRITMFSEPAVMEFEPTLFPAKDHSSSTFWVNPTFCTSMWLFTGVVVTCHTTSSDKVFFVNGLLVIALSFIGVWSSFQITAATSTPDILNWRGLFLSFHEHNWVARYTWNHTMFSLLALGVSLVYGLAQIYLLPHPPLSSALKFLLLVLVCAWFSIGLVLPFLRIWGRTLSYFEFFTSDDWNDEFWKKMSPYLRDLLYWRPVQPDSYIPPRPFYAGFDRKVNMRLVLVVAWVLVGLGLFVWLQMLKSDSARTAFANLSYALLAYALFLKEPRYRDDVSSDVRNLRDYVFFEKWVHAAFAVCIAAWVFYVLYMYKWGLLVFIAYWIWQVK